jgi:hypothetical protein
MMDPDGDALRAAWALSAGWLDGETAAEPEEVQAVSASRPAMAMISAAGPTRLSRVRPRGRDIDMDPMIPHHAGRRRLPGPGYVTSGAS